MAELYVSDAFGTVHRAHASTAGVAAFLPAVSGLLVARELEVMGYNLMTIYSSLTGKDYAAIEQEFAGKGYGDFKMAVGETVADHLQPIQDEFKKLFADKAYLKQCYTDGAAKALAYSQRIVSKVYHKVGFVDAR